MELEMHIGECIRIKSVGEFSNTLDLWVGSDGSIFYGKKKDANVSDGEYGCPGCKFSSNNKKDFNHIKGDTYHYCKDCIKKHNLDVKSEDSE